MNTKQTVESYFESLKGRIGIVSLASTFRPTSDALPNQGAAPGRPGINGLTVKKTIVLPATATADEVMAQPAQQHQCRPGESRDP